MAWNPYRLREMATRTFGSPAFDMDYLSSLLYDEKESPIAEPLGTYATPVSESEVRRVIGDLSPYRWSDLPSALVGALDVPYKVGPFPRASALPTKPVAMYDCPYCDYSDKTASGLNSHISRIHPAEHKEVVMREEIAKEMIDLNDDGKINSWDVALAARYGGVGAAVRALAKAKPSESVVGDVVEDERIRATDIPGQGATDELEVVGDDFDFIQRGGYPREMVSVFGYPEPFVYEGDGNMAYYPRSYRRWAVVPPGTPGAIPSRFRPGQWVLRVR